MTRTWRHEQPRPTKLRAVLAFVLGLALIAVSMVLLVGGLILAIFGVTVVFAGFDASARVNGVLFAVLGLAVIVGGGLTMQWLMPRAMSKLSGRKPTPLSGGSGSFYGGGFGGDSGCGGDGGC